VREKVCQKTGGCAITVFEKNLARPGKEEYDVRRLKSALEGYLLDDRVVLSSSTCQLWNRLTNKATWKYIKVTSV
jgi:hypothetical protein